MQSRTITLAEVRPVWVEDWQSGISASRWMVVGEPAPIARRNGGPPGFGALFVAGDQNGSSGVISRDPVTLEDGVTIEFSAKAPFTGDLFQGLVFGWMAELPASDSAAVWGFDLLYVDLNGFNDAILGSLEAPLRVLPLPTGHDEWTKYALEWAPSGEITFLVEDRVYVRGQGPRPPSSAHLGLAGGSVGTEVLYGPVRLYLGTRVR